MRVLELATGVAPALAATLFGDFGAEVVKVEPSGGDPARSLPGFVAWNRNKSTIGVAATGFLAELASGADVLVAGGPDDALAAWGLTLSALRAANPRLVCLLMPPYAGPAPWAGGRESHGLLTAVTGIAWRQASFADVPVDLVHPHCLYVQALWGATTALAALIERERSGLGQTVTVDGLHGALITAMSGIVLDPGAAEPSSAVGPGGPNPTYTPYRCQDGGWLLLAALTSKFQLSAFDVLGIDDLPRDPRLGGDLRKMVLPENRGWVRERITAAFAGAPRDHWVRALEAAGVPVGPVLDPERWLDHPQIRALGLAVEIADPERGVVVMPGVPVQLSATPGRVSRTLSGASPASVEWRPRPGAAAVAGRPGGPLAGLKVLDLGAFLAGPYAGSLLAELGADVDKIEPPGGDAFPRDMGFHYNRGQRSLAIDLRSPLGREVFERLVRASDVVLDNFRPGVLERLGIDHDALTRVNPGVITASLTGFGDTGPLREKPAFDPLLMAMSGMMAAQGGDDEPVFLTHAANDVTAAVTAVLGVCLALFHRERGGGGQRVASSLAAASAFLQSGGLVRYEGRPAPPRGSRDHRGPGPLDRYYQAADGWVRVEARSIASLAAAGVPVGGGADERADRVAGWFRSLPAHEAVRRLTRADVPAAVARRQSEMVSDSRLMAREYLEVVPRADGGVYYLPGRLAFFSRTQRRGTLASPGVGEHTRRVLEGHGLDRAEIDALLAGGVVVEGAPYQVKIRPNYR